MTYVKLGNGKILTVENASFSSVFLFIVSFGKKGALYNIYVTTPPPRHFNCRCATVECGK